MTRILILFVVLSTIFLAAPAHASPNAPRSPAEHHRMMAGHGCGS